MAQLVLTPRPAARRFSAGTPVCLLWTALAEDAASQDFCSLDETKMPIRLQLVTAGFALVTTPILSAQTAPETDTPAILDPILVIAAEASPVGRSFSLGPSAIAPPRAGTSDTAKLLTGLPGVSAYGGGGVSSLPAIRGLADERLRTTVDGMDLLASCPNHMNPPLSYIDPTAVERIEVFAGVTPVSVGGDSIGGTIVVESAPPVFAEPGKQLVEGEVGAFYRSNGDNWGGTLSATFASEYLSVNYRGAYTESNNYTAGGDFKDYDFTGRTGHTLDRDEVGSTAFEASNQSLTLAWTDGSTLLDLSYDHQDIPYEGFPNQRMDLKSNQSDQFNLGYASSLAWGRLNARVYYQQTRHEMDFGDDKRFWYGPGQPPLGAGGNTALNGMPCSPISGVRMVNGMMVGCAAGMPMETDSNNLGFTLNAEIPVGQDDLLRVGADYQRYRLDDWWSPSGAGMWPYSFDNINDGQRDRYAAFGEWELAKGRWTHLLGLRFEAVQMDAGPVSGYNLAMPPTSGTGGRGNQTRDAALFNSRSRSKTDHNWDLAWLARFTPDANQRYELGLGQKTRSPNLYERYTWSTWQMAALMNNFVGDGNGYIGNLDLKPEVARTLSVTADWHDADEQRWSLRITPYFTDVQDYIGAVQWNSMTNAPRSVPVVDDFTVLKYVNQSAQLYGIDLSADVQLASGTAYGAFSAQLAASYTRGKNEDTGDNLYNIMPLNATLILTQTKGRWQNAVEGEFVAAKDEVSQVRNEIETAGYALLHLYSRYQTQRWTLELGIENLFDRFYDLPLGGAYVGQGTTMTIPPAPNQPQWGTAVPGPGRSLHAALSYRF